MSGKSQKSAASANRGEGKSSAVSPPGFSDLRPQVQEQRNLQRKITEQGSSLPSALQRMPIEEEELMQGKFSPANAENTLQRDAEPNQTGMPDGVKSQMESAFSTDFSQVKIHSSSSKATDVGALAYAQGTDIHFAPGQFKPNSSEGQRLLGHELTHVVQQSEGRVKPTTSVGGMPVNDDRQLESEADTMGKIAAQTHPVKSK